MGVKNIVGELQVNGAKVLTELRSSEGLTYALSSDSTYYIVTGMGTCTDDELIIPSVYNGLPVKEIGDYAFEYIYYSYDGKEEGVTSGGNDLHSIVKKVIIPDSVTKIGKYAFAFIDDDDGEWDYPFIFENIELPDSIIEIGEYAFKNCYSLNILKLPQSLVVVGAGVFGNVNSISNNGDVLILPDTLTSIGGDYTFANTPSKIIISKNVLTIGEYAFGDPEDFTFYCEAETKPEGWDANWFGGFTSNTVVWGFANDFIAVNEKIPPSCDSSNNGQFLRVVDGIPAWATVLNAEEAGF